MQDAYSGVLGVHEGHTTKSCCPLQFTLLISRKSEKYYAQIIHFLCASFTDAVLFRHNNNKALRITFNSVCSKLCVRTVWP